MLNRSRLLIALIILMEFITGCEKSISFTPNNAEPLVVVEATIENGEAPLVILTKSLNYFSKISPELLAGSFVRNAEVFISNGTKTHKLKEYEVPIANSLSVFYYSTDSSSLSTSFAGEFATNYTLTIRADGKDYSSSTMIPALAKKIDSLWWLNAPNKEDSNKAILMVKTTDPPGLGNYIRYFTRVDDGLYFPGLNSVFDDQIIDGKTYSIQVDRGVDRNAEFDFDEYAFYDKGDTVTLKLTNIDKATFDFWRTMEYSYSSIGNPFSSPTKVLGNINGGALGYFGGYAADYRTIVIPK
ncbi:MAG: DUF4249 domain-containing protein [Chitinophagaceae bacterium]|nr:DUF4249 domain-containing protein [Chitinophagaceae bacterium]